MQDGMGDAPILLSVLHALKKVRGLDEGSEIIKMQPFSLVLRRTQPVNAPFNPLSHNAILPFYNFNIFARITTEYSLSALPFGVAMPMHHGPNSDNDANSDHIELCCPAIGSSQDLIRLQRRRVNRLAMNILDIA